MTQEIANSLIAGQRSSLLASLNLSKNRANTSFAGRTKFRVGFWPIISQSDPYTAMGLMAMLACLLERWPSIIVYRLPTQVNHKSDVLNWTITDSQFGVDDWSVDGLDENVAIWGSLEKSASGYSLVLNVENDFAGASTDSLVETISSPALASLMTQLPDLTHRIVDYLGAGEISAILTIYQTAEASDPQLTSLLEAFFKWELKIFQTLYGKSWAITDIQSDFRSLLDLSAPCSLEFGAWVASSAIARLLVARQDAIRELIGHELLSIRHEPLTAAVMYRHMLALISIRLENISRAYDLLESIVEDQSASSASWLLLAELYWHNGEPGVAVHALQSAINNAKATAEIYLRYAEMLLALDASQVTLAVGTKRKASTGRSFVEDFTLIDLAKIQTNRLAHEAIGAFQAAHNLMPDNAEIVSNLLNQMIEVRDPEMVTYLSKLVDLDKAGSHVRIAVENFYALDDFSPLLDILRVASAKSPERIDLLLNLAHAYLMNEQTDLAHKAIVAAEKLSPGNSVYASEIERLKLRVDDPDLDIRLSEIADTLDTGKLSSANDVDYLESVLERSPAFTEVYLLLARAYFAWDEAGDALDVLLDGQKLLPGSPEIAVQLAQVLWHLGEIQTAFDCLNQALRVNPQHVPLLALTGQFLFQDGQDEKSRVYLALAESLNPYDSLLAQVRTTIANALAARDI